MNLVSGEALVVTVSYTLSGLTYSLVSYFYNNNLINN